MMNSHKTPGVYIEEVSEPFSRIAQVPTAIPAFVGFTEKDPKPNMPIKVSSFQDYQTVFGEAPEPKNINIDLNTETYEVEDNSFRLYNSIRLFFANGGGDCYIVSIGTYDVPDWEISSGKFNDGIDLIQNVDEVTLILFPDGVKLGALELGYVHQHALKQCADLKDRFTIIDVVQNSENIQKDCSDFRDAIGNRNLRYGAAYYPYLQISSGYIFGFRIIAEKVDFKAYYASDPELIKSLEDFDKLLDDIYGSSAGILKKWETEVKTNSIVQNPENEEEVKEYFGNLWNLLAIFGKPGELSHEGLKVHLNSEISLTLVPNAQNLIDFKAEWEKLKKETEGNPAVVSLNALDANIRFGGAWGNISSYIPSQPNPFGNDTISKSLSGPCIETPDFFKIQSVLAEIHDQIVASLNAVIGSIHQYELTEENNITSKIPVYRKIMEGLSKAITTIPPSGAVAGRYANVDARRGVWKPPANISINGIERLTREIDDREQGDMNVHQSGKSINAIRKFPGRGFLIWGARTLDGNSNDWRYISTRRLAITIQDSIKKACMSFKFEPNDRNTWVRVKALIENFLNGLWREGALAGAKPEDAFFVKVGLGSTMTASDILEGLMIVEIGLAAVRPAEFLIIKMSQKMEES